jgi:hypothetical protein
MKKKFKIIDTSTGQKLKLRDKEMILHKWAMNSQGIFSIVGNFMDYDTYVRKLPDGCPVFDVEWNGREKSGD